MKKFITYICFGAYVALMIWLLFLQRVGWQHLLPYPEALRENLNLVPFGTIDSYALEIAAGGRETVHALINLTGNIVMFVPLGFFVKLIWPKAKGYIVFPVTLFLIEAIQLFTLLGSFDVDDLILNLCGTLIGVLLLKLYGFIRRHGGETRRSV